MFPLRFFRFGVALLATLAFSQLPYLQAVEPVIVPDDGQGTAAFPALSAPYVNGDRVRRTMRGLEQVSPEMTAELLSLQVDQVTSSEPGGTLGGDRRNCSGRALIVLERGGECLRSLELPVTLIMDRAPTQGGEEDQSYETELFFMEGELFGDPDFSLLRLRGGSSAGMPSAGGTSLRRLGAAGSDFAVDSFFDIRYRIEFETSAGSGLPAGSGESEATARCEQPLCLLGGVPYARHGGGGGGVIVVEAGLRLGGGGGGGRLWLGTGESWWRTSDAGGGGGRIWSQESHPTYGGLRWGYAGGLVLAEPGDSLNLGLEWKELDKASPLRCGTSFSNDGGQVSCVVDFSATGATQTRVEVWHLGRLVGSAVAPTGSAACTLPAGGFQLQEMGAQSRGPGGRHGRIAVRAAIDKASPLLASTSGGDFLGSELIFSPVDPVLEVGGLVGVDHDSSVSCVIDDDSVEIYDRDAKPLLSAVGNAGLSKADSKRGILVSNLGSSGEDGVSIRLDEGLDDPVVIRPERVVLALVGDDPGLDGLHLELRNSEGGSQVRHYSYKGGGGGGGRIMMADFSGIGARDAQVRVLDAEGLVGTTTVPLKGESPVCEVLAGPQGRPMLRSCGTLTSGQSLPGFFVEFDRPVSITPTSATDPMVGTRFEVSPGGASILPDPSVELVMACGGRDLCPVAVELGEIQHGDPDSEPLVVSGELPLLPDGAVFLCGRSMVFDTSASAGLPAGSEGLEFDFQLRDLVEVGPSDAGGIEYDATLEIAVQGTGGRKGYDYYRNLSTSCVLALGPNPFEGEDVQEYPVELVSLEVSLPGDDEDFSSMTLSCGLAGTGLPSPGFFDRRRVSDGEFEVGGTIDVTADLDFQGKQGGPLAGVSGATRSTSGWTMYQPTAFRWGHRLTPLGGSSFGGSPRGGLVITLPRDPSGVAIDLAGAHGGSVNWRPSRLQPGEYRVGIISGSGAGMPVDAPRFRVRWECPFATPSVYQIDYEAFSPEVSSTTVQVFAGDLLVGEAEGGATGSLTAEPVVVGNDLPGVKTHTVSNVATDGSGTPFFGGSASIEFDAEVAMRVSGGEVMVGDRMRVCVDGPPVVSFDELRFESNESAGLEIEGASTLWSGRWLECPDGTVFRCLDGTCRISGTTCPSSRPYLCPSGTCEISRVNCPPVAGLPSFGPVTRVKEHSGRATGRRQHGPVSISTGGSGAGSPGDSIGVEMRGTVGGVEDQVVGSAELRNTGTSFLTSVQWPYVLNAQTRVMILANPIHEGSTTEGTNPLYEGIAPPGGSPAMIDAAAKVVVSSCSGAPGEGNPLDCPAYLAFAFEQPVPIVAPDGQTYQGREIILIPDGSGLPEVSDVSSLTPLVGGADSELLISGFVSGPLWYTGLAHLSTGSCVVEPGANGLRVDNIGSSGQDGVTIRLGEGEGGRFEWEVVPLSAPGASMRCVAGVRAGDVTQDGRSELVLVSRGDGSCGVSSEGFCPSSVVVCRDAQGREVGRFALVNGEAGSCRVEPEGEVGVLLCGSTPHLISSGGAEGHGIYAAFSSPVLFTPAVGGAPVSCSRVHVVCDNGCPTCRPYRTTDHAFSCVFSGVGERVLLSSEVCQFRATPHRGLGSARLRADAEPDTMRVSNLGSSGQDGVSIDLRDGGGFSTGGTGGEDRFSENISLSLEPVPLNTRYGGGGGGGRITLVAKGVFIPDGGAGQPLGRCELATDEPGDSLPLEADFSELGATQARVIVMQDGQVSGEVVLGSDEAARLRPVDATTPHLVGCGKLRSERIPGGWGPPCFVWTFDRPVEVGSSSGEPGTGPVGNEVRVVAEGAPPVFGLTAFDLLLIGDGELGSLETLTISDLPRSDFASWLAQLFSEAEIDQLATGDFRSDLDGDGCDEICEFTNGTDPHVADFSSDAGLGFSTIAGVGDRRHVRLVYHTADVEGFEIVLRSTGDLSSWNPDPEQFRLISREMLADGRTRWEWEVNAAVGSKTQEFYGHVTVLK